MANNFGIVPSVAVLSATQAIVTYKFTNDYLEARTLNISGTTVTAGAALAVNAVVTHNSQVTALSATQALVTYMDGDYLGGDVFTRTLNISGTTVTAGALLTVSTVNANLAMVTALSATQVVVVFWNRDTGYLNTCTLNISGTTVTAGTILITTFITNSFVATLLDF